MLTHKHNLYPNEYNLQTINQQKSLNEMTQHLLLQYTEFDSVENYLQGYSIIGDRLRSLTIASNVYISKDDPVIPYKDHNHLYPVNCLNIKLTQHGGHCGYLKGLFEMNWIDEQIINELSE